MTRVVKEEELVKETQPKKKSKTIDLDDECQLFIMRVTLIIFSVGACIYCLYRCSACLLVIMVVSACFCISSPWLVIPFFCSLGFYVATHMPILRQALTVSEDVYKLREMYK
jgi:hypothetical protein